MTTMAELKQGAHNSALVRKILSSVAFYAPYSAEMPTSYFSTGGVLAPAPTGFNPLGMTEKDDAFTFASDTDTEEVEAHGYPSAVRVDITKTTRTVASTFLETRKQTLELATGTDLSNVTVDANGAIEIVESETSARPHGRLVIIAVQGGVKSEINAGQVLRRRLTVTGSTLRPRPVAFKAAIAQSLQQRVWPLLEKGTVKPVIHSSFPAADAAAAHTLMEAGRHVGKIVLTW